MNILVIGGAGYIGSHTAMALLEKGYEVTVLDNLEVGHRGAVAKEAKFIQGDIRDEAFLQKALSENKVDAAIHFAAYSQVGESVSEPLKYYQNNVYGTKNILEALKKNDVGHIVFSSTASVYGEPKRLPIEETDEKDPKSPYGETKLAIEKMLYWADNAYGLKHAVLRYFNVAGAHVSGKIGEDHRPETHLIPNILKAAVDTSIRLSIFGDDYDTPDGTCVRDYVHVSDLASAHILALEHMMKTNTSNTYNVGSGTGFSNKEILETAIRITGVPIAYDMKGRRAGDPAKLVASSAKIERELGWKRELGSLENIIETAWRWHKNNPKGFEQ